MIPFLRFFKQTLFCPCCEGTFLKFLPSGVKLRKNARCPRCGSLERHRLLWLYLLHRTDFFKAKRRVLDVAPQPFLQERWRALKNIDYVSVDLSSRLAMFRTDISRAAFKDNQFDVIFCCHVLEHIPDDRQALRELFRILKPGGWAILQFPVNLNRETTFEDLSVVSPEERERIFGQKDHVRVYGRDYAQRIENAGFLLKTEHFAEKLGAGKIRKYGLMRHDALFIGHKLTN